MEDYDNKKDRNVVLISAFISFALNSTVRFFIPVLLPFLIVSLNINLYLGSLLITSYWIGYTLFQIPSGIIADRFGTAKVNKISFIALTIAFTFLFFVRTDFSALIAVQVFLGIFSAFIYITDASLVQKWTPLKRRASFVGLYQTGFFVGASLGEFFILETFKLSFIVPFSITLTFLFMACILNIFFIKDPNVKKIKERGKLSRNIIYVCFIRFSAGFSYIGFLSLFTSFIIFDHITSFSNAYSLAWIPAVGGLLGSPLGGYLSMKHNRGKAILSIFPTILMGLSLIVLPQVSFVYVIALCSLSGFFYGLYAGPSMSMASDVSGGDENLSASSGIINFSSQIGGSMSPLIVGYLFSIYSNFNLAFSIIGTISILFLIPPIIKFLFMPKINYLFKDTVHKLL